MGLQQVCVCYENGSGNVFPAQPVSNEPLCLSCFPKLKAANKEIKLFERTIKVNGK